MPTEEQRAADYRAEQTARASATLARVVGMAGSRSARAALSVAWAPIIFANGALQTIAPGMYIGADDLTPTCAGGDELEPPYTGQLA